MIGLGLGMAINVATVRGLDKKMKDAGGQGFINPQKNSPELAKENPEDKDLISKLKSNDLLNTSHSSSNTVESTRPKLLSEKYYKQY